MYYALKLAGELGWYMGTKKRNNRKRLNIVLIVDVK